MNWRMVTKVIHYLLGGGGRGTSDVGGGITFKLWVGVQHAQLWSKYHLFPRASARTKDFHLPQGVPSFPWLSGPVARVFCTTVNWLWPNTMGGGTTTGFEGVNPHRAEALLGLCIPNRFVPSPKLCEWDSSWLTTSHKSNRSHVCSSFQGVTHAPGATVPRSVRLLNFPAVTRESHVSLFEKQVLWGWEQMYDGGVCCFRFTNRDDSRFHGFFAVCKRQPS